MRAIHIRHVMLIVLLLFLCSCSGYYFPHLYEGPQRSVYMPTWPNRTNKLGLDAEIYQALARWFLKSDSLTITKDKESADLVLAGEIVSISLPSISWNSSSAATSTKVKLGVRYVLKDLASGEILWEVPKQIWTENYASDTVDAAVENEALSEIVDDLAESIYLGTLKILRQLDEGASVNNG